MTSRVKPFYHVLQYDLPASNPETDELFEQNRKYMSISGIQEKFAVLLEKNKLRLIKEGSSKLAQDDFASLAGRTPQTHVEHYKYLGNYLELFQ